MSTSAIRPVAIPVMSRLDPPTQASPPAGEVTGIASPADKAGPRDTRLKKNKG